MIASNALLVLALTFFTRSAIAVIHRDAVLTRRTTMRKIVLADIRVTVTLEANITTSIRLTLGIQTDFTRVTRVAFFPARSDGIRDANVILQVITRNARCRLASACRRTGTTRPTRELRAIVAMTPTVLQRIFFASRQIGMVTCVTRITALPTLAFAFIRRTIDIACIVVTTTMLLRIFFATVVIDVIPLFTRGNLACSFATHDTAIDARRV